MNTRGFHMTMSQTRVRKSRNARRRFVTEKLGQVRIRLVAGSFGRAVTSRYEPLRVANGLDSLADLLR
jgi:hypothetical protein